MKLHPRFRRRLPINLPGAAFAVLVSMPSAAQEVRIDCGAMHAMASQAYSEIRNAVAAEDYPSAYRLKNVFWEIEKYGGNCQSVRGLGKLLSQNRLGPKDSYSAPPKISKTIVSDGGSYGASGTSGSTASPSQDTGSGYSGSSGTSSASGTTGTTGSAATSSTGASTQTTNRQDGPG